MTEWFHAKDAAQHGPDDEAALRARFDSGELSGETLVWTDGQGEWKPAREVPPWAERFAPASPASTHAGAQVRPWVRYWARYMDVILWSFLVGVLLAILSIELNGRLAEFVAGLVILASWIPVEALFLSRFGTTPGKALLRVRIQTEAGGRPDFRTALDRSFQAWLLGMGAGVVTLFTLILSYRRLRREGRAPWDQASGLVVRHEPVGPWRVAAALLCWLLFVVLSIVGALAQTPGS